MKTAQIQECILKNTYCSNSPWCVTNYSGGGYSEMDVVTITKAMLVTEHEVKVSRSDFFADFKKSKHKYYLAAPSVNYKRPNKFYYCCPKGMIKEHEVPVWAGLIYFSEEINSEMEMGVVMQVVKKAPRIHKEKCEPELIFNICQTLTARSIYGCALMTHKNREARKAYEKYQSRETNTIFNP